VQIDHGEMAIFRFVTVIPLELWAIVLLLLFMSVSMGLWWMIGTVVLLAMLEGGRTSYRPVKWVRMLDLRTSKPKLNACACGASARQHMSAIQDAYKEC
jgi:hypothetical protein